MFTKTFTDPQGVTHTDAIFEVSTSRCNENASSEYSFNLSAGDDPANQTEASNTNNNLSYRIYYWTDQGARDSGKLPYVLANTSPVGEWFNVNDIDSAYDILTAEEKAEKHCQDVVLV